MERTGRSPAWMLVAAMIVGALVVPRVASAVGSIVTIQGGGSTQKASVTKAHQLQVAEAQPSTFHAFEANVAQTSCTTIVTVPANKGYIVKTISIAVTSADGSGLPLAVIYPNGTCSGSQVLAAAPTDGTEVFTVPIEPGFALAAGKKLSVTVANTAGIAVSIFGYLVPPGDVPATTPIDF